MLFQTANQKLNNEDEVAVKVVTDEGEGDYITTVNVFKSKAFNKEMQAYLWYIWYKRDLGNFRDNIQKHLEEEGYIYNEYVSRECYTNDAEYFAEQIDEQMNSILELNYTDEFANSMYGHTVIDIQIELLNKEQESFICTPKKYSEILEKEVVQTLIDYVISTEMDYDFAFDGCLNSCG